MSVAAPAPGAARVDEPVFSVLGVASVANAATPTLRFHLHVDDPLGRAIHTIALSTQIQIDPARRSYDRESRERLVELFGAPERWAATTQPLRWAHVDTLVQGFTGATSFAVDVPCTYDLEVAASKYFSSLPGGEVALTFLFNGMVLYAGEHDRLQVAQVPWSCVARWRMPVDAWQRAMAAHYPGGGWVVLQTETLQALADSKARHGDHSFDAAIRRLLG
jgi:hypothetical protein